MGDVGWRLAFHLPSALAALVASLQAACTLTDRPVFTTLSASLAGYQHHSGRLSRLMACKHHLASEERQGRTL